MDRYAVIGNPVEHSLSPRIHSAFAAQTQQRMEYGKLHCPVDRFAERAREFFAAGGRGLNVTVPFKGAAAELADALDGDAGAAAAVNTLHATDSGLRGYNTDGAGLVQDLTGNLGLALGGQSILILGAGGATQGIVRPLLAQGIGALTIAKRTESKAAALIAALASQHPGAELRACALDAVSGSFDLLINATSAGLANEGDLIDAHLARGRFCYDLLYAAPGSTTAYCRWARSAGADTADGLGMLVEQAALAFQIWRGLRPETAPVLADLRGAHR